MIDDDNYEYERLKIEAECEGLISAWDTRQERQVLERLGSTKVRKGTRHWVGEGSGEKTINAHAVVAPDRWADDLVRQLMPMLEVVSNQHANRLARKMKKAGIHDAMQQDGDGYPDSRSALGQLVGSNLDAQRLVRTYLGDIEKMIRDSAQRQSDRVQKVIADMEANGDSIDDIKREVRKMVSTRGSWRKGLAIHATTAAIEGVKSAVIDQAGPTVTKTWRTRHDERVRPAHKAANGQTVMGGESFKVGGFPMRFPGDPVAPIELVINCRCHVEVNRV